jgi:hypothetical protein
MGLKRDFEQLKWCAEEEYEGSPEEDGPFEVFSPHFFGT